MIEIRYNSLDAIGMEQRLEQKNNDEIRTKEKTRRNAL
jgi:hypothetical protein